MNYSLQDENKSSEIGKVAQANRPSPQEAEAGGQSFKASLSYTGRHCLKNSQKTQNKQTAVNNHVTCPYRWSHCLTCFSWMPEAWAWFGGIGLSLPFLLFGLAGSRWLDNRWLFE